MDFLQTLEKLQEAQDVNDDSIIDAYLAKKNQKRKPGMSYSVDRTDPKNLKIRILPANQAKQLQTNAQKAASQIKQVLTK